MTRKRDTRADVGKIPDHRIVPDTGACVDDDELANVRTNRHDGLGRNVCPVAEFGRRRDLRRRVNERREVVSAQLPVDLLADCVVANGNENGRTGEVARSLRRGSQQRVALKVPRGLRRVVIGKANYIPHWLRQRSIDALNRPNRLAAKAARTDNE